MVDGKAENSLAETPSPTFADPFSQALRAPDLMEKLCSHPDTRQHMADPGFLANIEKLRGIATDPTVDITDLTKQAEIGQKIARAGHNDPRIMQALMTLQGMGLTVEEKDLKRAEDFGDMPRREPVQLEQLQLVRDVEDPDECKSRGNDYFKKGDLAAALAHYEKGIELLKAREDVPAVALATLFSNAAMCFLKLKWPDRAKKHATMAISTLRAAGDESFDQSKLFYRRALACEMRQEFNMAVDDMARALQQAKKTNVALAEQHRLKGELERLKKLKLSHEEHLKKKASEKEGEKIAEVQRMQGTKLVEKSTAPKAHTDGNLQEQDFSHFAMQRIKEVVRGISHKGDSGCTVEISELDEERSKVNASITTKRGTRALYYDMDLHCNWTAKASPKLQPSDGSSGELKGLIRVYNIGHDTKFELGGDENTSYMYQLGWDQRKKGKWVEDIQVEAAELFDLVAVKADGIIRELRKK